ncbi:hypothetical protein [Streptomyces anulatus]|uniref:hypothetical protein n=1 Tax=Streptomyces anulatus TaxID=1892 RepID=UPI0036DA017A
MNKLSTQTNRVAFSCTFVCRAMTVGKFVRHVNAAPARAAFISIATPQKSPCEVNRAQLEGFMVPRVGLTVDIHPRDLPIALIGTAGGALALWADAPAEIAVPVALLIVLDIRIRRWSRRV